MKITKIILFFVSFILSFLFFTKDTLAVTFNGSNDFKLQSVAFSNNVSDTNLASKTLWSFDIKNTINDIVGINCISYIGKNCTNYVVQTTQIFKIDFNIDYSDSNLTNNYLLGKESYVDPDSEVMVKANWIYEGERNRENRKTLEIYYQLHNWDKKTIYEFDVNRQCGTDNPKVCVLALNSFWTYSSHSATTGVYLTYSDISLYNSASDKVVINRIHNKKSKLPEPGFFSWLPDFNIFGRLQKNTWAYGLRVANIKEDYFIYIQKDKEKSISDTGNNRSYKWIKYVKDEKTWDYYFSTLEKFTYDREISEWYYTRIPRLNSGYNTRSVWQFDDFVYENYRKLSPYFNKFLWGEFYKPIQDGTLIYTLQDIFWFNSSFFQQQGEANSQDNSSSDWLVENVCEWVDIWCHIKNLSVSIGRFLGNIWNWFADVIKGIFTWVFETIKNFISPFVEPLWTNILKPVYEFFYSFFEPIWRIVTGKSNYQEFLWWSNDYICKKASWFYIDIETPPAMKPAELMGFFLYLANPIPPLDGSKICTNIGVKTLNYWRSTIVDTLIFLFFIVAGLWFLFYIVRE